MANTTFYVTASFDEEAQVFVSDSNIVGLHIEAATLEEFEAAMNEHASLMIVENHFTKTDVATKSIAELIPSIFMNVRGGTLTAA